MSDDEMKRDAAGWRQTAEAVRKARAASSFAGPPGSAAGALAQGVWNVAKEREMLFEDIIGCCAILVSSVASNSGESEEYLITEIKRRAALVKQSNS